MQKVIVSGKMEAKDYIDSVFNVLKGLEVERRNLKHIVSFKDTGILQEGVENTHLLTWLFKLYAMFIL